MNTYYQCPRCHNLIQALKEPANVPMCCGKWMQTISENDIKHAINVEKTALTSDTSLIRITIGALDLHPMTPEHHITSISLKTNETNYSYYLQAQDEIPAAEFIISQDEFIEYISIVCNIHGLFVKSFS